MTIREADGTGGVARPVARSVDSSQGPGRRCHPRRSVALLLLGLAGGVSACGGAEAPIGPAPSLPPGVVATAAAEVAKLPEPPPDPVADPAARSLITGFATEAQRVVGSGVELTQSSCNSLASGLAAVVAPDDLFAAAGRVEDPDLRALLLNARAQVGAVLASCTQGEPVDVAKARESVALLQARLGEKR